MKNILSFISALILLFLQGCEHASTIETYNRFRNQRIDYRDSIFVLYTVSNWHRLNWDIYSDYSKMYKMNNDEISYFLGGVFYSHDKLKMLVW